MSGERDERPLAEIQFAGDWHDPEIRHAACEIVRSALASAGVAVAQDIVDLGCTGLIARLPVSIEGGREVAARFVRANMAGSICGLPCYVPPDRFCLVHNTIGALQLVGNVDGPQRNPHPEGVALCSRELTDEERKQAGIMAAAIDEHARKAAKDLGFEPVDEPCEDTEALGAPLKNRGLPLLSGFCCPEHSEPVWRCRFCLAAAVIAGPFEPELLLQRIDGSTNVEGFGDFENLEAFLAAGNKTVGLFVCAARWARKLVRDGG